ncbi:cyclin-C [Apodospora peruviana]|uniref:RNA polymerase II holoenzyme cyclin-like subunit n=1 Tax=Apodospora peruviana TaxID=516989 RepID=A0AAE0M1S3_9PEZI|nr:cyclin-C [Apodospora peruviana]
MAANYWESTQRKHWQFTKDELATMRQNLEDEDPGLVHMFPLPELRYLNIYFNQQINRLGKRLGVRQQAMATAQIYVKRFYTKIEIRRTNPYLLIATAVYLACKMEETPQHIRLVGQEARSLWPGEMHHTNAGETTTKMGECEFWLISEMNSQLIVHQPYRTLTARTPDFSLVPEEVSLAWSIINDHYMTDLPLLYPPHIIALTAILLAVVMLPTPKSAAGGASAANPQVPGLAAAQAALAQIRAGVVPTGTGGNSGSSTPTLTPQSSGGLTMLGENGGGVVGVVDNNGNKVIDPKLAKVQRIGRWLAESNIDIEAMIDCTQELISFYECHEKYNDKHTREQLNRFIKARGL